MKLHRPFRHAAATLLLSLPATLVFAGDVKLTAGNEVPPVQSSASGSGTIDVSADGMVSGSVKTTGVQGTMAHIHVGAEGKNGPVIIPLAKGADGEWMVPP